MKSEYESDNEISVGVELQQAASLQVFVFVNVAERCRV